MKWKYQKKGDYNKDLFLNLEDDKKSVIKISSWGITKKDVDGITKDVFQADVLKCDGRNMKHLIWISNRDNVEYLKKALKKGEKEAELEITKHYDKDNMEVYYKLKVLK